MSEEDQEPIYIDNRQYPSEVRIPYPFIVTDATLQAFLAEQGRELRFGSRWRQTSSGSAIYTLTTETKQRLGELAVRAIDDQETYIKAITTSPLPDYLPWLLARFMWWIRDDLQGIQARATISPIPIRAAPAPLELAPQTAQPPQRGDPVDVWLDWRETERKRGRRLTLDQIVEESGWSKSTITKRSAERKTRG